MGGPRSTMAVFGRASVTLEGPIGFFIEEAPPSDDLVGLDYAELVCAFAVGAGAGVPEDQATEVIIRFDGDTDVLVAVLEFRGGMFCLNAREEDPDGIAFSITANPDGVRIHVLSLPSRAEARRWVENYLVGLGVGGAMAEPPEAAAPPEPAAPPPPPPPPTFGLGPDDGQQEQQMEEQQQEEEAVAGEAPPELVPAHALAEMPQTTRVGEVAEVTFTLSWVALTPTAGAAFDTAEFPIDPEAPITVSIATRGYRIVKGTQRTRKLSLRSADKASVTFRLQAVTAGNAEVTLVVRQHHELPLATLRLRSQIVEVAAQASKITASVDAAQPDPTVTALPTLRIDESLAGGESFLDIAVQIGTAHASCRTKIVDKPGLISWVYEQVAGLRDTLKRMKAEGSNPSERAETGLVELRALGVDLSRRLFNREVREFLWQHLDDLDHLVIQTTGEFDIPWEVIYLSDPTRSVKEEPRVVAEHFLGMRGATRWVYNSAIPTHITVGRGRAKYLCPAYTGPGLSLGFTQKEGELVRNTFRARVVRPGNAEAVSRVVTSGFDLLHFGGHGVWTQTPPDQRILLARYRKDAAAPPDSSYSASDLRRDLPDRIIEDSAAPAPMVFLNACDVGRIDTSAPGLGGFPEAFLRGGVGVLLGCSWAVDDEIAGEFSHAFYKALEDSDIAEAMTRARAETLQQADLSALAYVAYAHPHARVTIT